MVKKKKRTGIYLAKDAEGNFRKYSFLFVNHKSKKFSFSCSQFCNDYSFELYYELFFLL